MSIESPQLTLHFVYIFTPHLIKCQSSSMEGIELILPSSFLYYIWASQRLLKYILLYKILIEERVKSVTKIMNVYNPKFSVLSSSSSPEWLKLDLIWKKLSEIPLFRSISPCLRVMCMSTPYFVPWHLEGGKRFPIKDGCCLKKTTAHGEILDFLFIIIADMKIGLRGYVGRFEITGSTYPSVSSFTFLGLIPNDGYRNHGINHKSILWKQSQFSSLTYFSSLKKICWMSSKCGHGPF